MPEAKQKAIVSSTKESVMNLTLARFLAAGLVGTTLSTPLLAQSAGYVTGTAGITFPNDLTTDAGLRGQLKDGYALTLAAGTAVGPIRAELEGSYRESKVAGARGFGLSLPGTGHASALSAMANAYFDPAFHFGPLKPYVGAGLGISRFRASNVSAVGLPFLGPITGFGPVTGSRTGFAYQAMAGVGVALAPRTTLTVGYRYFATPGVNTNAGQFGRIHIDGLKIHGLEAGLRFAF